jgi:SAM-dependent methyltransferase
MFREKLKAHLFGKAAAPQPARETQPAAASPVLSGLDKEAILARYRQLSLNEYGYATVRDFCDSADQLPNLMLFNGDLKDVQRPWTFKAVIASVPPGARVLEIGGGEPRVAAALTELGYEVTLVDPYDGAGNGPTEYERYVHQYPGVRILKDRFGAHLPFDPASFDAIFSISVLEHLPPEEVTGVYAGLKKWLRPGGHSLHCVDSVIGGNDTEYHYGQLKLILREQQLLAAPASAPDNGLYDQLLARMRADIETFYLSAQGHHLWRGGLAYEKFPFRQTVSIQTCVTCGLIVGNDTGNLG